MTKRTLSAEQQTQLALARGSAKPTPIGKSIPRGCNKVEVLLSREHMSEYLKFLLCPDATLHRAKQWLKERGYAIGIYAIGRHRQQYRDTIKSVRRTSMLVQSILHVARESGTDVSEASVSFVEHQLMESLHKTVEAQTGGAFDAEKWQQIVRVVGDSLRNHALMMDMFKEHGIKPKKPFDGEAIAREMRRQLGIPPWPESKAKALPTPADPAKHFGL